MELIPCGKCAQAKGLTLQTRLEVVSMIKDETDYLCYYCMKVHRRKPYKRQELRPRSRPAPEQLTFFDITDHITMR